MHWGDDTEEAFPPRHPREPGGLRQDILDEIADHLACAAEREAERGDGNDNEETVRNRVLERFGNPNTLARKLWWDEMRETVMREWIQTGVMVVVAVAVVAFMALVTRQMSTANQAVLEALKRNTTAVNPLVTLTVKVTRGSEEGPPAEGVEVRVSGIAFGNEQTHMTRVVGASGTVTFGPMQPGQFEVYAWDRNSGMRRDNVRATLFAGNEPEMISIIAPDLTPRLIQLDFSESFALSDGHALRAHIKTHWGDKGETWMGSATAIVDASGVFSLDGDITDDEYYDFSEGSDWSLIKSQRHPFQVSGELSKLYVTLVSRAENSNNSVKEDLTGLLSSEAVTPLEGGTGYRVDLPDSFKKLMDDWRAQEELSARGIVLDEKLYQTLRGSFPELAVDEVVRMARTQSGLCLGGALVSFPTNTDLQGKLFLSNRTLEADLRPLGETLGINSCQWISILQGPPEAFLQSSDKGRILLALNVPTLNAEEFEQSLQIWPVLNPVLEQNWLPFEGLDAASLSSAPKPSLATSPAATMSVSELLTQVSNHRTEAYDWILFDLSDNLRSADASVKGSEFLLRWEKSDPEYKSQLSIISAEAKELKLEQFRPMWLVMTPMAEEEAVAAQ